MNILQEIVDRKRQEIKKRQSQRGLEALQKTPRTVPLLNFREALVKGGLRVIAEMKRKSPSAGDIFRDADPVAVATDYEQNGATAISVLTDWNYFGGSLAFLQQIKSAVSIPVLRKDFIISEYQVYESYVAGADAILLIVEALNKSELLTLYQLAQALGMDVLLEFHAKENVPVIRRFMPDIVGVNTRNLETMTTNLYGCQDIYEYLPDSSVKVAESGIHTSADLQFIAETGYDAALIGTVLMKNGSPGKTLARLLAGDLN